MTVSDDGTQVYVLYKPCRKITVTYFPLKKFPPENRQSATLPSWFSI